MRAITLRKWILVWLVTITSSAVGAPSPLETDNERLLLKPGRPPIIFAAVPIFKGPVKSIQQEMPVPSGYFFNVWEFDRSGHLITQTSKSDRGEGGRTFKWKNDQLVVIGLLKGSSGGTYEYVYDKQGRAVLEQSESGGKKYEYKKLSDGSVEQTEIAASDGRVIRVFIYDSRGRLIRNQDMFGTSTVIWREQGGRISARLEKSDGNIEERTWDHDGNLLIWIGSDVRNSNVFYGEFRTYTFDHYGNWTSYTSKPPVRSSDGRYVPATGRDHASKTRTIEYWQ